MEKFKKVKRIISILLAFIMSVSLLSVTTTPVQAEVTADYSWYGDGSANTFTISTPAQLLGLANIVNGADGKTKDSFESKTVILTANIDLSSVCSAANGSWNSIGNAVALAFAGTFDGAGYKVSNIYIDEKKSYRGLFGYTKNATIKNVGVSGSIVVSAYVGGIVGYCEGGTILNCYNECAVESVSFAGGIVGNSKGANISNCYNIGNIDFNRYGGGVAGGSNTSNISNCYNMGKVTGTGDMTGGIVGSSDGTTIETCYNIGSISGSLNSGDDTGGIVGTTMSSGNPSVISNCISLGEEIKGRVVGRITGRRASDATLSGNTARSDMSVIVGETPVDSLDNKEADQLNGADITVSRATIMSAVFGANWSSNVWQFTGTNTFKPGANLPTLKGLPATQNPYLPGNVIALESIGITKAPTKTSYAVGESFDSAGMLVTATFKDTTTELVTDYTVTPLRALTASDSAVTISYTFAGVTKTTTQKIAVNAPKSLIVTISPTSATVIQGKSKTFTAKIDGVASGNVTWSVSGNKSKKTKVSTSGKLTVSSDEKATTLTVKAVSKADKTKFATAKIKIAAKMNTKFTSGNFTYIITNDKTTGSGMVTLTGLVKGKKVTSLTVPATVKCQSISYKVTAVGDKAFDQNKRLRKAVIGNNVTKIGKNAFRGCTSLTEVTVGNKVTKILSGAFLQCTSLKKITIGTGLKEIGTHAFCMDKALRTMTIKSTKLTKVGEHSMNETTNLKIKVPAAKVRAYKTLFANKLQGKNVKVIK